MQTFLQLICKKQLANPTWYPWRTLFFGNIEKHNLSKHCDTQVIISWERRPFCRQCTQEIQLASIWPKGRVNWGSILVPRASPSGANLLVNIPPYSRVKFWPSILANLESILVSRASPSGANLLVNIPPYSRVKFWPSILGNLESIWYPELARLGSIFWSKFHPIPWSNFDKAFWPTWNQFWYPELARLGPIFWSKFHRSTWSNFDQAFWSTWNKLWYPLRARLGPNPDWKSKDPQASKAFALDWTSWPISKAQVGVCFFQRSKRSVSEKSTLDLCQASQTIAKLFVLYERKIQQHSISRCVRRLVLWSKVGEIVSM